MDVRIDTHALAHVRRRAPSDMHRCGRAHMDVRRRTARIMRADVCRQVRLVHVRWRMGADVR